MDIFCFFLLSLESMNHLPVSSISLSTNFILIDQNACVCFFSAPFLFHSFLMGYHVYVNSSTSFIASPVFLPFQWDNM